MDKSISTLVKDIQHLVTQKNGWFTDELATDFSREVSRRLIDQYAESTRKATLRLSKMGSSCPKALWHSVHTPERADPLPAWTEIKFSVGHVMEPLVILLCKCAGHRVEGEQDELTLDGIVGHRDCVIDGCVVDIKSCSSRMFAKFKTKKIRYTDDFGYLDQLDGYVVASHDDPLVTVKDKGYILAVDKTLGHMVLYEHEIRPEAIRERIKLHKEIVSLPTAPRCNCSTVPEGQSGNVRLDTKASYSAFKHCCFPLLRTFLYVGGPMYLTKVVRVPDVPELTKHRRGLHATPIQDSQAIAS